MSQQPELAGRLACVTFAPPERLGAFAREIGTDVPLYADCDRAVYAALGFGRGSVRRVWLDRRVWRRYAQLLRSGQRPAHNDQDKLQLGGDAVVAHGRLAWIHRSAGPDDRPAPDVVADALRAAG